MSWILREARSIDVLQFFLTNYIRLCSYAMHVQMATSFTVFFTHKWTLKRHTNQRQCDHSLWPEANVRQQYRKGPDHLVHQIFS